MKLKIGAIEFEGTAEELTQVKDLVRELGEELGDGLASACRGVDDKYAQELLLTITQALIARVDFSRAGAEEA